MVRQRDSHKEAEIRQVEISSKWRQPAHNPRSRDREAQYPPGNAKAWLGSCSVYLCEEPWASSLWEKARRGSSSWCFQEDDLLEKGSSLKEARLVEVTWLGCHFALCREVWYKQTSFSFVWLISFLFVWLIHFILFYFILFYFILFYFILFHCILFCFVLFYFILFYSPGSCRHKSLACPWDWKGKGVFGLLFYAPVWRAMVNKLVERSNKLADTGSVLAPIRVNGFEVKCLGHHFDLHRELWGEENVCLFVFLFVCFSLF